MSQDYLKPTAHWKKSKSRFHLPFHFRPSRSFIKNLLLAFLVLCAGGSILVLAAFAWVSRDLPDPDKLLSRDVQQSTKIYDRTGTHILYEIHGDQNRTLVKIEDIPDIMKQATISVEDQQFYNHIGFNPIRTVEGIVVGLITKGRPQGGSTLTQQLVKNAILTNERTVTRKIKELLLSVAIEQHFTKDQILQLYFNEIPYGSTNYGVESASEAYFGKSVKDITLPEAATLAALPQAPTTYLNNPDALLARRNTVLKLMEGQGYITDDQAKAAEATPLELNDNVGTNIIAPHFVFYVKQQLVDQYGESMVEQGGLKVITTLDYDKQQDAQQAVVDGVAAKGKNYRFANAGLVAIDPKTGQILAMVGSPDYNDKDNGGAVNAAASSFQPGSSFKPIVYSYAFTKGYTPNTILYDVVTTFNTEVGPYTPHNYSLEENGPVTVRKALQGSLNIPAVKMMWLVGVQNVLDYADTLGYSTFGDRSNFGLSVVLGGGNVTPVDHTSAYATFANDGVRHPTASILEVDDASGNVLQKWQPDGGEQVIDPNAVRELTNVLSDNAARAYVFGAANHLTLPDRPVAAKTGTTNDYYDAWTLGYTPSLAAGVWVGNVNHKPMVRGADGSVVAAPIWQEFMEKALAGTPVEQFTAPSIPVTGKAILDGQLPSTTVVIDKSSGLLATDATPPDQRQTLVCGSYHSELYYIDPTNPLGPEPGNQPNNPDFVSWEAAIQDWVARTNSINPSLLPFQSCNAPTGSDDVHTAANKPSVHITSPGNGSTVAQRSINVTVEASAPRGVSRLEYAIDGKFIETSTSITGTTAPLPSWVTPGTHTLTATAFDDVDNSGSDQVNINVTAAAPSSTVSLIDPINTQTIEKQSTGQAYAPIVQVSSPGTLAAVSLFSEPRAGGSPTLIGTISKPTSLYLTFSWALPAAGDYVLFAQATDSHGNVIDSGETVVTVTDTTTTSTQQLDLTQKEAAPSTDTNSSAPTTP